MRPHIAALAAPMRERRPTRIGLSGDPCCLFDGGNGKDNGEGGSYQAFPVSYSILREHLGTPPLWWGGGNG